MSGGGIRSATFCFGVLRALAQHKLLLRFDLLSTVSGGGYVGGMLGRLFDRATVPDDVVKVDGKRVALGEVEGCLEAFPKIKAAQATVITDPMAGAMVVARVVTKQKSTAEEIIAHTRSLIAGYKAPKSIDFIAALPRNPSGKVLRRELRAPFWEGRERLVG